jgi:AAA+ superfamily predicted ATPase
MTDQDARVRALRAAVRIAPADADLLRLLADAELASGDIDAAIGSYREVVALRPKDGDAKLGLARAYRAAGKTGAALVVLEDRRVDASDDPAAFLLEASILADLGRLEEAGRAYVAAIEANPLLADLELATRIGAHAIADVDRPASEQTSPAVWPPSGAEAQPWGIPEPDKSETPVEDDRERVPAEPYGPGSGAPGAWPLLERPRITFADVGGMEPVKEEIRRKIIAPLEHPDLYKAYGQRAGGGILMYGPPGCGKTYLARATAGEVRAAFMAVGIADVLDMWIGASERNLRSIFEGARAHRPSVLFFDEVDALAAKRTDFHGATGRNVVNQFLDELDGIDDDNERMLVLAATNAPWHLDPAFRRPGRFDQVIFVPPPDRDARAAILAILLRDRPASGVDIQTIAGRTDGFSGADLKGLVDAAIGDRLADAIRKGIPVPITTGDLTSALGRITPSTTEWFATARNYVLYANEGGLYDPVRPYLKRR